MSSSVNAREVYLNIYRDREREYKRERERGWQRQRRQSSSVAASIHVKGVKGVKGVKQDR